MNRELARRSCEQVDRRRLTCCLMNRMDEPVNQKHLVCRRSCLGEMLDEVVQIWLEVLATQLLPLECPEVVSPVHLPVTRTAVKPLLFVPRWPLTILQYKS